MRMNALAVKVAWNSAQKFLPLMKQKKKAEVILPEGGPEDCIEEAMDTCPVECILWEE